MEDNKYKPGDILAVDADWVNETYYFLIEGELSFVDARMEFLYPYRCLNDGKTGWGNFGNPSTRRIA